MVKTTVYLPEDVKVSLTRAAERRGVSEAEIIREAVRRDVAVERPAPRPGVFSIPGTSAADVDDMLADGFGEW